MKKVYLETPEAVIKALKDGKEVFLDEGGAGKVVLIDGFCVKQWNDQFNINYTINLRDKPYILEEEPLKIEVGKWYETRDHQKARCYYKEGNFAFVSIDNYINPICVFINGSVYNNKTSSFDIIGPWKEDK